MTHLKTLSAAWVTALMFSCGAVSALEQAEPYPSGDKKFGAGLTFSDTATADDVGLPLYPGAAPRRDKNSAGVNLGFWGGSFGLKVVVVELTSPDSADKVATFYQEALAKYGDVLDCSQATPSDDARDRKNKLRPLACDRDRARKKGQVYKVGTRERYRVASIQPRGSGSAFQLIYIEKRGAD